MITFNIGCEQHLKKLINIMLNKIVQYKYHIFKGEVGSGKTTIIKTILKSLNVPQDEVTSPTFNYIKILECNIGKAVHIDLYRVEQKEKIIEILQSEDADIYFIEWGEVLEQIKNIYQAIKQEMVIWKLSKTFNNRTLNIDRNLI